MKRKLLFVLMVPVSFLIVGVMTLEDYGMNWDEPFHFFRGQAYLHFFLTGEEDYSALPTYPRLNETCPEWADGSCNISPGGATDTLPSEQKGPLYEEAAESLVSEESQKRSFFQHDIYTYETLVGSEDGHPPVGGIMAAATNYVFFRKLGLLGDIESHHLLEVFSAFMIVLGVGVLVYKKFGVFPSMIASFSLAAYPLFFAESHFNIKDPLLASFFGLTIIFFYFGVVNRRIPLFLPAGIFLGLATGVKFNTAFLPLIIVPWFLFFILKKLYAKSKAERKKYLKSMLPVFVAALFVPVVAFAVFYLLWPFLWGDVFGSLLAIIAFYRQIGTGATQGMQNYLINGWNSYPIIWIILTTPIPILVLAAVGTARSVIKFIRGDDFSLLILLWFVVPILRVTWPDTVIYGGVRQIMEYIPAMAVLSGIGAFTLYEFFDRRFRKKNWAKSIISLVIVGSLIFVFFEVRNTHPNQNVYFSQLIGGLRGAKAANIPSWGNSYGNAYQQGVNWINENAEPNAKLGLPISTMGNISRLKLRSDIDFFNGHWSGPARGGEYEIEVNFDWPPTKWYSFRYYDVYLEPVYEVEVQGVPILKVWKNDLEHTRPGFEEEMGYSPVEIDNGGQQLEIDLGREIPITRLVIEHAINSCNEPRGGYIALSSDGETWIREPEPISVPQVPPEAVGFDEDTFVFLFAAKHARYIQLNTGVEQGCILNEPEIRILGLKESVV